MANDAVMIGPSNHKNYFTLAKVFYQFGLLYKAIESLDKALHLEARKYGTDFEDARALKDKIELEISPDYKNDLRLLDQLQIRTTPITPSISSGIIIRHNPSKGYGFIRSESKKKMIYSFM